MLATLEFLILLGVITTLLFFRTKSIIWTPVVAIVLILYSIFSSLYWWVLLLSWMIYLLLAVTLNIQSLRRSLLSKRIFNHFKKIIPPMSDTERTALEAGHTWWEGDLFCGRPDWHKCLNMPKPQLTQEEQAFVDNQTEQLCALLDDWQIVHSEKDLPKPVWQMIKKERFFALVIAKEHGGHGFSALAHSTIIQKIASRSLSAAVTVMVPNSLGPAELLHIYGTEKQRKYYLPRLAKSQEIPCFGLTAVETGSDAASMHDSGIVCKGEFKGKEVLGIRLNFYKRYITLAPIATLLGLAFKLYDPDHLLGDVENIGITLCLVPTDLPGVSKGKRHLPMGQPFMNGPIEGKDVFVPIDNIIGGAEMRGKGWQMLMEALSVGRSISLPALATAACKLSFRMTGAYAKLRQQFKTSIGNFEGVQEALARIGGFSYLCEATRLFTLVAVDQGIRPSLASAISKYHLTELGRKAVQDGMDVHGGRAVQLGPRNYIAQVFQGMPISITVEGANILTRNLIIFGQGAVRCHPHIRNEMEQLSSDKLNSLIEFDREFFTHVGYTASNVVKALVYSLTGGHLIGITVATKIKPYYQQLTRMSMALAVVADFAMMLLGGELKRKERLSARLGDVLSHLYMGSAVLKYYHDQGEPDTDLSFVHWSLDYCLQKIQHAFYQFFANLKHEREIGWVNRILVRLIKRVVFPLGTAYAEPLDTDGADIAMLMQVPSALRDRLTQGCYVGDSTTDPTGRIDIALNEMIAAQALTQKLRLGIKAGRVARDADFETQLKQAQQAEVLVADEVKQLRRLNTLVIAALHVDEFSLDELKGIKSKSAVKTKAATT